MSSTLQAPPPDGEKGSKKEKKKSTIPDGLVIPPPKQPKPTTKAERRALQEAQRAAKAAAGGGSSSQAQNKGKQQPVLPASSSSSSTGIKAKEPGSSTSTTRAPVAAAAETKGSSSTATNTGASATAPPLLGRGFFSHLTPYRGDPKLRFATGPEIVVSEEDATTASSTLSSSYNPSLLHPDVIRLGYLYATGAIRGGNARCRAMLHTYQQAIKDYQPYYATAQEKDQQELTTEQQRDNKERDWRHVVDTQLLKPSFAYWTEHGRPHNVSMGNAFTFMKQAVASLPRDISLQELKATLLETIEAYITERMDLSHQAIATLASEKVLFPSSSDREPPVLVVYGYSQVVAATLLHAAAMGRSFRVIVVDSRPLLEGRIMLKVLRSAEIDCCYILLNALHHVLTTSCSSVSKTKVLLGASALMSDGSVLGRVGTAAVAMAARAKHIPVIVCAETYKISNRVQLESITHNEMGSASDDDDYNASSSPRRLSLLYDLCPAAFVSGILTELGIVPPTSVAVLLREMNLQQQQQQQQYQQTMTT